MAPKDLALTIKNSLERESILTDVPDYGFDFEAYNENLAIARVSKFIQGRWKNFKIIVMDEGFDEDLLVMKKAVEA